MRLNLIHQLMTMKSIYQILKSFEEIDVQMAVTVAAFAFTLEVILITKYDIIYNLKLLKIYL
jgi:hypothetical protein